MADHIPEQKDSPMPHTMVVVSLGDFLQADRDRGREARQRVLEERMALLRDYGGCSD